MLRYALLGALVAGAYGVIHDQITYTISPEYFTKQKFQQFRYANFGYPPRVFVAEIGFLATWWVGFFATWFLARIAVPAFPPVQARHYIARAMLIILSGALIGFGTGYLIGLWHGPNYSAWEDAAWALGIVNIRTFVWVAYIHNGGYLGALIGFLVAIAWLLHAKRLHRRIS
jgi:hypothetical protein